MRLEALIAVTYRCNARCRMCYIWKYPTEPKEEIKPEHLEKLPSGLPFANITGGEPFVRTDLDEIVKVLKKKAKRIVISTNGFFTDRIIDIAKKHKDIGIRISIEGLPKANDELRGIKDGFDKGLRTLLELHRLGLKDIGFGITLSDANIHDLNMLWEMSKMMGLEFATAAVHNSYYFHKFDNKINKLEEINKEFDKLICDMLHSKRIKNWFRAYFNYGLKNYVNGGKRLLPCEAGTDLVFVDPYGEVHPCNAMEDSMGNIKFQSWEEIWNGKKAQQIREKVKKCKKNCWMIGSVAPAMKKRVWIPILWILKNKFIKQDFVTPAEKNKKL